MSAHQDTGNAVLGIDLGTSSVKAVVCTASGEVLAQASHGYAVNSPKPGWSETDPKEWLTATVRAVRLAVGTAQCTPIAIGFAGQMHGLVVADRQGVPLRPAMLWSDSRAMPQLAVYDGLPAAVRTQLANPLSPGMAGPMLGWLAASEPQTFTGVRWALQPKDWLRAQLTGQFHTDPSDASATLLYNVAETDWDATVLEALGISGRVLPDILASSAETAGALTADGADLLAVPAGLPVAAGAGDTAAAALASGLTVPGTAQLTVGTGAQVVQPIQGLPDPLPDRPVTHLYRAATRTGWYRMGAVLNGGMALTWVCRVLGADWRELYAAAASGPHLDDPFFLPHLSGERTPYLDSSLRGAWTNLEPRHERKDLLRAALEGVAFAVRAALDPVLEPGSGVHELRLAGGGTADPNWRQMLADVLGYPLTTVDVAAASGLGAALLGAITAGVTDEQTLTAQHPRPSRTTTTPRPELTSLYGERYSAFTGKVLALRGTAGSPASHLGDQPPAA